MLSAIAARKAAQAVQPAPQPESSKDDSDVSSSCEQEELLRSPKRRRREKNGDAAKRQKTRSKPESRRYFAQPTTTTQLEELNETEESSSNTSSGDELPEFADVGQRAPRAWSPSGPFNNSHPDNDRETASISIPTFVAIPGKNLLSADRLVDGRKGCIIVLDENETVAFIGAYYLTVLRGTVSLMGTELSASTRSYPVFAPKCSPIPIIRGFSSDNSVSASPLSEPIAQSAGTAVLLQDMSSGVEGLGHVCRTFEGIFDAQADSKTGLHTASMVASFARNMTPFSLPPSWDKAFTSLGSDIEQLGEASPPVILVRGPRRTGKSTFARTTLNRLLQSFHRVAYLECDVGQTEFTPPGLISLNVLESPVFGPPFTHPTPPLASHFIGSTSPKNSPSHYIQCIQALVQTYKTELQWSVSDETSPADERIADRIPLVVNTMGWSKGLGADLSKQIEETLEPSHVFSLGAADEVSVDATNVIACEPIPSDLQSLRFSASDWRALSMLSYFHSKDSLGDAILWDCSLPLLARAPYSVSVSRAVDGIVLLGAGTEDVVQSEVHRVLNGAIVALVTSDDEQRVHDSSPVYLQGSPPPDPFSSNCVGLALIRGVSSRSLHSEDITLQLLTPVPASTLASACPRILVKGEVELPIWGFLDFRRQDTPVDAVPYLSWGKGVGVGAERRRVRRNLMRRGQQ